MTRGIVLITLALCIFTGVILSDMREALARAERKQERAEVAALEASLLAARLENDLLAVDLDVVTGRISPEEGEEAKREIRASYTK